MEQKYKSIYRPVRLSPEMDAKIADLAAQRKLTKSEVLRDLVDSGMKAQGVAPDQDRLYEIVKAAVEEVVHPGVERLAKISAKAAQVDAASFFMYLYTLSRDASFGEKAELQEAVESARKLGIQYLKLKDRDIDSFLRGGAEKISEL